MSLLADVTTWGFLTDEDEARHATAHNGSGRFRTDHVGYPGAVASVPTLAVRGARLYPLMKVYRRLTLGPQENLATFYKMVSGRLEGDDAQSKEGIEGVI